MNPIMTYIKTLYGEGSGTLLTDLTVSKFLLKCGIAEIEIRLDLFKIWCFYFNY